MCSLFETTCPPRIIISFTELGIIERPMIPLWSVYLSSHITDDSMWCIHVPSPTRYVQVGQAQSTVAFNATVKKKIP